MGDNLENVYAGPRNNIEEKLVSIWQDILGLPRVGIFDNFFELGGDSTLILEVVSRASNLGLRFHPRHLLQYQTIAELAEVEGKGPPIHAEQDLVKGEVPLTPMQCESFETEDPDRHIFNVSFLMEVPQQLDSGWLEMATAALIAHHDALRLRSVQEAWGWRQYIAAPEPPVPFARFDLSDLSEAEQTAAIESRCAQLQTSLDLTNGPILRVAHFYLGIPRPDRLLMTVHHTACDGLSFLTLLEDFFSAYHQLSLGQPIHLPRKTTSLKHWAERLAEYAQSEALREELPYWTADHRTKIPPLPVDYPGGLHVGASSRTARVALSREDSEALNKKAVRHNVHMETLMLAALTRTLAEWSQERTQLIDLMTHGREQIFEDVNLSRTVGWFNYPFPVVVELPRGTGLAEAIESVSEQLRRAPHRGIGYGLLRYLCRTPGVRERMRALPRSEVFVNCPPNLDHRAHTMLGSIQLAKESGGPTGSPRVVRRHLFQIHAHTGEGRLMVDWEYGETVHKTSTVEHLMQELIATLQAYARDTNSIPTR